jgi:uncharacterized protein YbjT (DUF2867 family)
MALTACIAGATGLTGQALTKLLLTDARYGAIKVLVRKPGSMPVTLHSPKLIEVVTDYEAMTVQGTWNAGDVDHMFICLGTTMKKARSKANFKQVDYEYVVAVANGARDHGADHCAVISAMGVGTDSKAYYIKIKTMMEAALQIIGYPTLHILRPSLLLGPRTQSRPLESIAIFFAQLVQPILIGPWTKYRAIPAKTVAAAMQVGTYEDMRITLRITESDQILSLQP